MMCSLGRENDSLRGSLSRSSMVLRDGLSVFLRARTATKLPARHVPGLHLALLTCLGSHRTSVPARTWLASHSSYVPGQPQNFRPGTYLACISLFLRAWTATEPPSRHVPGLLLALLTCPPARSASTPTRRWQLLCSLYVPGKSQNSRPGTYLACISLFLRAWTATKLPARHVYGLHLALLTCLPGRCVSTPTRK